MQSRNENKILYYVAWKTYIVQLHEYFLYDP